MRFQGPPPKFQAAAPCVSMGFAAGGLTPDDGAAADGTAVSGTGEGSSAVSSTTTSASEPASGKPRKRYHLPVLVAAAS